MTTIGHKCSPEGQGVCCYTCCCTLTAWSGDFHGVEYLVQMSKYVPVFLSLLLDWMKFHEARVYAWFILVFFTESVLHKMGTKVFFEWKHEGPEVLCFYNSPFFIPNTVMGRIMETVRPRKYCLSLFTHPPQYYSQIVDNLLFITLPRILKKNRTIHTWATHICENVQCSHSSQLVHHWLVSKLWKETSKFSLC